MIAPCVWEDYAEVMTAIEQMTKEHQLIKAVINSLQGDTKALDDSKPLDTAKLRQAVEFLRVYADKRHHEREEAIFFPLLVKLGVPPQGCPLGGLAKDHERGRDMVTVLEEQISRYEQNPSDARAKLAEALKEIVTMYRHHLWMEDSMVFPMADNLVTDEHDRELQQKFAELDTKLGEDTVARMEKFAGSLG